MAKTSGRGQVQYHLEKVEDLPPDEAQRGMRYHNILSRIMDDPGSTYLIATFSTESGASVVKKELDTRQKKIPAGKWEFEVRRVTESNAGAEKRVSKLYARYMGEE